MFASAAARLMNTFAMQVEVFRRLRNGGHQYVRVEHVHVNDGGQAVIGNVKKRPARPRNGVHPIRRASRKTGRWAQWGP
jgi:hypothetical protein